MKRSFQPLHPSTARRILFFGGDQVSVVTLAAIHERLVREGGALEVVHPLSPPVKSRSAKPELNPVESFCRERGIKAHVVDHPKSIAQSNFRCAWEAPKSSFDAVVVASCRYFLPKSLLDALPPAINMHPSLLPKYRGASPIFETLRRGDSEGGVSVIKLESRFLMDCGDVLVSKPLSIDPEWTYREYFPKASQEGAAAIVTALDNFAELWARATPQPDNTLHFSKDPFHAPLLGRHPGRLSFHSMTADQARNTWRAFVSYTPVSALLCKGATPCGVNIKCEQKRKPISAVFNEVLHPCRVSDAVHRELAIVEGQAKPGAAYFPYTRNTDGSVVGAVKCKEGWLFYDSLTLRNATAQKPATIAASAECRLGTVYNNVFVDHHCGE